MTKTVAGVALLLFACASSASASVIIQRHRPHIAPIAPAAAAAGGDVVVDTISFMNTTNTSADLTHTFGASANAFCVGLMQQDGGQVANAPTIGGGGWTGTKYMDTGSNSAYVNGQIWCGVYSGGSGAKTITVTQPDAQKLIAVGISFNNVHQTTPFRSSGTISDLSTSLATISTGAFTTGSGGMLFAVSGAAGLSDSPITPGAGETLRVTMDPFGAQIHMIATTKPSDSGGAQVTVTMTAPDNDRLAMGFVEMRKQ